VYKCIDKKTGELRAVKQMRTDDEEKLMAAKHEYEIQKDLKHPNIIEVKDMYFDSIRNTMYTVMELVDGKPLDEYIYWSGPLAGIAFYL
jgi:serine/threonine protein kinase